MRIATLNVLADSYIKFGDYSHVRPQELLKPGARTEGLVRLIGSLQADVIGLQEVEQPLVDALRDSGEWSSIFYAQKHQAPDGSAMLVKGDASPNDYEQHYFSDGSGHVMQLLKAGSLAIANTHIKWDLQNRTVQTEEVLERVRHMPRAILLGDYNDRPGEPAHQMVAEAGFVHVWGDEPTAFIANRDGKAAIDFAAVRGVDARQVQLGLGDNLSLETIPNPACPTDHIPVMIETI
jgi:endonuclease/exonuclease/phosphatase family metal-dependent hydrolase